MKELKNIILLLLLAMMVFPVVAQKKKHHHKNAYDCKKVGQQKVHAHKFTHKELNHRKEYVHAPSQSRLQELAKKKQEEFVKLALATKKVKEETLVVKSEPVTPNPSPVYFRFDSDELQIVDIFQVGLAVRHAQAGKSVHLVGHTDNEGSEEYNLNLSIKRAEKIKQMMLEMDNSLDPDKITVAGQGEKSPTVANDSRDHKLENRRVVFTIKK